MFSKSALGALALAQLSIAGYVVQDSYDTSNFFDQFTFYDQADPTDGFVDYVTASVANSSGLIDTSGDSVYIGTDHTNQAPNGRPSVRITSNKSYSSGLVVLDLEHFPGGICGTWPAFWMTGPNWPQDGEIDIMEGVNTQSTNSMTLHTSSGCEITSGSNAMAGTMDTSNCFVNAADQDENAGCGISDTEEFTYSGFNEAKGGVFATEIDPDNNAINIWFFARTSIPSDITSGSPDPSSWGQPRASFSGGCDIASHFQDLQIVFDLTFCGSWAGDSWSSDSTCAALSSTCDGYVQDNPSAFTDAYWTINSLKVYQAGSDSSSSSSAAAYSTPAASTPSIAVNSIAYGVNSILSEVIPTAEASAPAYSTPADSAAAYSTPAESYATPSTFAVLTKSAAGTGSPVPYPAGNKTLGYATGSSAGTAPVGIYTPYFRHHVDHVADSAYTPGYDGEDNAEVMVATSTAMNVAVDYVTDYVTASTEVYDTVTSYATVTASAPAKLRGRHAAHFAAHQKRDFRHAGI